MQWSLAPYHVQRPCTARNDASARLSGTAKKYGKILRQPKDPQLYFYDSKGDVLTDDKIDINNVNSIMFTPAGESYPAATGKMSSKAGLCIAFKPAESLTAALIVSVSRLERYPKPCL
ncbi:hypothetical protein WJX77_011071 [Trebouxia sp. C0004]